MIKELMKITIPKINKVFNNAQKYFCTNVTPNNIQSTKNISFCSNSIQRQDVELKLDKEKRFFEEFLHRKGKVTKEEYEDIIANHPHVLIKAQQYCQKYRGNTTPKELAFVTLALKEKLDKLYDNYRIISIGTSPAPIAEQLQNMGEDIVFIPVSGFNPWTNEDCSPEANPNLQLLINYIKSKNINDNKLNIVMDYKCTGQTLENIANLIKEKCGISDESITKVGLDFSFIFFLPYSSKSSGERLSRENCYYDMSRQHIEEISNVPHFPVFESLRNLKYNNDSMKITTEGKTQEEVFREFEDFSQPLARAYSLCTMHEINKMKNRK